MVPIRNRGREWESQIRRKGHRTISRSFDTKTDAKTWARQIEVGLELGNLELPDVHDLRHEAISRFFEKGLSVSEVASISGHRDLRMLQRYAHARNEVIIAKLDQS